MIEKAHYNDFLFAPVEIGQAIKDMERKLAEARAKLADVKDRRQSGFRGVGLVPWLEYNERVTHRSNH